MEHTARRLREARQRAGLSLRQLGARTGVTASALSQIENQRVRPSVPTLYALVTVLGLSLDELIASEEATPTVAPVDLDDRFRQVESQRDGGSGVVVRRADRRVLHVDSGVTWEKLADGGNPGTDHLFVTYAPGGASSVDDMLTRHAGFEYAVLLDGELVLRLEFEEHHLTPGDSVGFDATRPHAYRNDGDVPAVGVWYVAGRLGPHQSSTR